MRRLTALAALAAALALPELIQAQTAPATPAAATPGFDFSGLFFGSYSMRTDSAAKATLGGKNPNSFNLDRAYLTFRMPAGDNGAIRVTTDLFQNGSTAATNYYQGWSIR